MKTNNFWIILHNNVVQLSIPTEYHSKLIYFMKPWEGIVKPIEIITYINNKRWIMNHAWRHCMKNHTNSWTSWIKMN